MSSDLSTAQSPSSSTKFPHAKAALTLLLFINLFNYIDRYLLALGNALYRENFFLFAARPRRLGCPPAGPVPASLRFHAEAGFGRTAFYRLHRHLHVICSTVWTAGRTLLALGACRRGHLRLELGQRRIRLGGNLPGLAGDALLRRNRGGCLRAGSSGHHLGSISDSTPWPGPFLVLHRIAHRFGHRLRSRRANRQIRNRKLWCAAFRLLAGKLALGLLSGHPAGTAAWNLLLLS